jgi:hypothetical protein
MPKARVNVPTYGRPTKARKKPTAKKTTRKKKGSPSSNGGKHKACMAVCSGIDPFCPASAGSKIHDANAMRSTSYTVKLSRPLNADANGFAGCYLIPGFNNCMRYMTNFSADGASATTGAWSIEGQIELDQNFSQYRVVSSGFRVFCSANTNESKGFVQLVTAPTGSTNWQVGSMQYVEAEQFSLADLDATWISKPEGPMANLYQLMDAQSDRTVGAALFGGCTPGTTVARVEFVINYELISNPGKFTSTTATQAAPDNPALRMKQSQVLTVAPSAMAGSIQSRSKSLYDYASEGISWAAHHPAEILSVLEMI